jgi:hypothetical protein
MAAGRLPEPGSEFGPCIGECKHLDCAEVRHDAAALCAMCKTAIGYGVAFFRVMNRELVHEQCALQAIERERV